LNEAVLAGRIGTVVVWSLECLFSRLKEAVGILAFLCGRGVRVVSVVQKIDLDESAGSTLVPVMLSLMEIEEIYRRKQQATGIAAAKERGVYTGRKPGATKAEPQMVQVLKKRGLTVPQISSMFNVSERTVRRYLRLTEQS
jgi:DNA invertase Pin-like site-specific DNA recombinase